MEKARRQATTVYLDPKIARAMKVKAALTDQSVSDLVNNALTARLRQDEEDLRVVRQRRGARGRSYEDVLRDLMRDGLL